MLLRILANVIATFHLINLFPLQLIVGSALHLCHLIVEHNEVASTDIEAREMIHRILRIVDILKH